MPHAVAIEYGLDWDTEIRSFWSWFKEARNALDDLPDESASLVRDLVETQKEAIREIAGREKYPEETEFVLRVAVALVGLHYASNQKLLRALQDAGLFVPVAPGPPLEQP